MSVRKPSINEIQDHPDNESNTEKKHEKLKYPKSVFFIISNEFCERFSYYGMRTVLTLYLRNQLLYSLDMATVIYHTFTMFVYFFPLIGAILADSFLGKFRTIFYLSIVYAIGQLLLALSAAPPLGIPAREFSLVGLFLIAIGTGGIKPCVTAFGGDQFILPQQERYLSTFFSLFYFSINSGSLISSFLTPVLRSDVECFGQSSCYSLAFVIPAILMALSIVIFVLGKPLYKIAKPTGNVVLNVSKCICHAIYKKITTKNEKREYWLEYADDKYDKSLINDIRGALQVMILFLPIPIFWALFDQQGSRWTIQATKMDGQIGSFLLQPDQMQVLNPLLVLAFIPLFETCLYPLMGKIGLRTPLRVFTIGGFLASFSFVAAALVELNLEKTYPVLPSNGFTQLRIFNTMDCPVQIQLDEKPAFVINNLDMWVDQYIKTNGTLELNYSANFTKCKNAGIMNIPETDNGTITLSEGIAISSAIVPNGIIVQYNDSVDKSLTGDPLLRNLISVQWSEIPISLKLVKDDKVALDLKINSSIEFNPLATVKPNDYDILLNNALIKKNVPFKLGGVYTIVGSIIEDKEAVNVITVTEPNSMHMLWLLPQYVIITMGEVMFSVTGLEFAFTQAPSSMKSLLQASWLLTVAFGNLIVVIVAEVSFFNRQIFEYILFAGLMFVDIIIFAIMARFYKYVDTSIPED
ncbi:PREDICTED: solute carrier family 15 member 1-like isoform X1 [Eufriesea mexicana]|uniref:solute carrier family 15 member 1-like isoform X1 n=1 Tax=Eufriesea mexicana TaxID=516756 RepID=UPI00083C507B|nr:PREDICTED: solute carrier family 15 member 1-like isoform X1 [Eufriesea mexicana]